MPMLAMTQVTATVVVPTAVRVTTIVAAAAAFVVGTHVVPQGAAGSATGSGADQATCAASHTTANHVAAGRTEPATDSRLATAVSVRAYCATCRAANTCANGRPGAATQLLANHRTQNPTQRSAHARFGGTTREGGATEQAKGQCNYRGKLHEVNLRLMMDAMLKPAPRTFKPFATKHAIGSQNP